LPPDTNSQTLEDIPNDPTFSKKYILTSTLSNIKRKKKSGKVGSFGMSSKV
jgi:hypothetical protein